MPSWWRMKAAPARRREHELGRPLVGPGAAAAHGLSRCTATATASACSRVTPRLAWTSSPIRRCGGWPAWTTCTCTVSRENSRRTNNAEVVRSAHDCLTPLADPDDVTDVVMPAFSSGQWAGTMPATIAAVPSGDLMFMCGGGILAHPGGTAAGVASLRQAWRAIGAGQSLAAAAHERRNLATRSRSSAQDNRRQ